MCCVTLSDPQYSCKSQQRVGNHLTAPLSLLQTMAKTLSNSNPPPRQIRCTVGKIPPLPSTLSHPPSLPRLSASRAVIGGRSHLSLLQPIGPGEELLVWYTVEDNPEITAALEEERGSSLNRKNSPRAKRGEA